MPLLPQDALEPAIDDEDDVVTHDIRRSDQLTLAKALGEAPEAQFFLVSGVQRREEWKISFQKLPDHVRIPVSLWMMIEEKSLADHSGFRSTHELMSNPPDIESEYRLPPSLGRCQSNFQQFK